jgi:uroporphyrinogen decarboxylase
MKRPMKSKERVLTAVARQEPDRVPLDYFGNPGINARMKAHFGLAEDDREGLSRALEIDFRNVHARYTGPRLHPELPDRKVDPQWGIRTCWIEHSSGGYWDFCDFPLRDAGADELARWPMPSPDDFDYEQAAQEAREKSEYCVTAGGAGIGDVINQSGMLRTMEQVLVDLVSDDEGFLAFVDRRINTMAEVMYRTLEAADGACDLLWIGEDLGTQLGPMISLELFRRHIRPRLQKFVDVGKAFGVPVMMHSCGSSSWAYDDLIDMGVAAMDTLQPEAANMSPAYLKERFGDRLAFHGCISTAGVVARGTVEQTVENVRQTLEVMMPGGGYMLSPTHMLQDNSPTENVVAMYDAARRFGNYH